jgi:hypothetical protein
VKNITKVKSLLAIGAVLVPAAIWAVDCDRGLASTYLPGCDVGTPSGKSTKREYNPTTIFFCTSVPGSNKRCIVGSVEFFRKDTVYDNPSGCSGTVHSTVPWYSIGNFAQDGLCRCP